MSNKPPENQLIPIDNANWRPTCELRYYTRALQRGPANGFDFAAHHTRGVLRQKWISDDGDEEWRDIPHSGVTTFV